MKNICIITDPFYGKDRLFNPDDPISNRDGCLMHMVQFKKNVELLGYSVHTSDILPPSEADFRFYIEMPLEKPGPTAINYLFLFESEVIRADNWDMSRHNDFDKIFTWNDALVDNKRYFKMNFLVYPSEIIKDHGKKEKLLTQISGNKIVYHPNELYSERLKSIRWWESNHPEEFTFYGVGWENPTWGKPFWNFNKKSWLRSLSRPFRCYGGKINKKQDVLKKYKFSLCYENAFGYPGYITEKIFDCFFAGTVPIYWGAPNIEDHIPKDCFIDRMKFNSNKDLREYIVKMPDQEYERYQANIFDFLTGTAMKPFISSFFSEAVIPHLK